MGMQFGIVFVMDVMMRVKRRAMCDAGVKCELIVGRAQMRCVAFTVLPGIY